MRRIIRLLSLCTAAAWLVLCLPCIALASGYDGESVLLLATDKLSTRNGPGTKYRETGTFDLRGEYVTVLTCEEDANGVSWVECEFAWKGELMRVYTGLKRFVCEDASEIFYALPWYFDAKALRTVPARYGPGEEYAAYDSLTMDKGRRYRSCGWKATGRRWNGPPRSRATASGSHWMPSTVRICTNSACESPHTFLSKVWGRF